MRVGLLRGHRRPSQPQYPPQLVVLALQLLLLCLQGGQRLLLARQLAAANWATGWNGGWVLQSHAQVHLSSSASWNRAATLPAAHTACYIKCAAHVGTLQPSLAAPKPPRTVRAPGNPECSAAPPRRCPAGPPARRAPPERKKGRVRQAATTREAAAGRANRLHCMHQHQRCTDPV